MQPTNDNHMNGGLQYVIKHNDNDNSSSSNRMYNRELKGNGGERKSDKISNVFSISNKTTRYEGEINIKSGCPYATYRYSGFVQD